MTIRTNDRVDQGCLDEMQILEFSSINGSRSKCGVTFQLSNNALTVVLTELPENTGMSVTNQFEDIATWVVQNCIWSHQPEAIRWIEHYLETERSQGKCQTWDTVTMKWDGNKYHSPHWQFLKDDPIHSKSREARLG